MGYQGDVSKAAIYGMRLPPCRRALRGQRGHKHVWFTETLAFRRIARTLRRPLASGPDPEQAEPVASQFGF